MAFVLDSATEGAQRMQKRKLLWEPDRCSVYS